MRSAAVLLAACVVLAALAMVSAQNTVVITPSFANQQPNPNEQEAVMTKPAAGLKKPIIFDPPPPPGSVEENVPIIGDAPSNLVQSAISENIYGGDVEWRLGANRRGCPCKYAANDKRYDVQYKRSHPNWFLTPEQLLAQTNYGAGAVAAPGSPSAAAPGTGCSCRRRRHHRRFFRQPNPEDALPPVIARLKPERNETREAIWLARRMGVLHPLDPLVGKCLQTINGLQQAPTPDKIAPSYYPKRWADFSAPPPCLKQTLDAAAATAAAATAKIVPEFKLTEYERRLRRRARRRAKFLAAQQAAGLPLH